MFCSHCGASLTQEAQFCPACGQSIKKKPRSIWKSIFAVLGIGLALFLIAAYFYSDDLESTVESQLVAIKNNQLTEAYYGFTSKEFQASNSFEKFKEFIRSFPILQSFKKVTLAQINVEDNLGDVKAILQTSTDTDGELLYKLIKEDNKWKVLGIQLIEFQKTGSEEPSTATAALISPIENLLSALQSNDWLPAYKNLTSQEFQDHTSFEAFKAFILKNPILTRANHYDFKEHSAEGDKGSVTIILNPGQEGTLVQYRLTKENETWKIAEMRVLGSAGNANESAGMIRVVREQLEDLKKNQINKAYEFISEDLKKDTPLATYQQFIQNYPAFTNHSVANINEPYVEEGIGRLTVELKNDQGVTLVEYALGEEEGQWRVKGIHVEESPETSKTVQEKDIKNFKTRELMDVIQSFLGALRGQNLKKAYQYTSSKFQEENSFKNFEDFIKNHPEFVKHTTSSFEKLSFNNNIATFAGEIIHSENIAMPVEFDLIQDNGKWRILHIFVSPAIDTSKQQTTPAIKNSTIEFSKIVLGSKIDDHGIVIDPTELFKTGTDDIYVNLYVRNGKAGETVDLLLRHVDSGSSIPVVKNELSDNGDNMLSYAFSPPPAGWPKGTYQLKASSNNSVFKTYTFKVE